MASIPVNFKGQRIAAGSFTGSYSGFTVGTAPAAFSALLDGKGNDMGAITFPSGFTIPLYITSGSFTGGPIIAYP